MRKAAVSGLSPDMQQLLPRTAAAIQPTNCSDGPMSAIGT